MRYLATHEHAPRGTFDFPIELYYVDPSHPRYEMPFHWHMEHELILVLQGVLRLSVEGEAFELAPGDCMLIADGAIHGGTPEGCIYECLVFDLERFLAGTTTCGQRAALLTGGDARLEGKFPAGTQAAAIVSQLFQAMETERPGYELTTMGLLWQLWGELLGQRLLGAAEPGPPRDIRRAQAVKNVLRRIRSSYGQPLTLEDLAAEAALEPKYFCRVFRQITGRTPINYLNYYRVECAAELLCTTQGSITDIALECGFGDVSYFSRMFRRYKGQTPGQYRRAHLAAG